MNKTAGKILVEGNAAAAMGCMFAGVTVVAWYPITPSSSLPRDADRLHAEVPHDKETGKATFAIVQAEDEIAALGMVIGAGWAGARAMTSTSGPGISLMCEFAGLAYYAELPAWSSTSSASARRPACRRARRRATCSSRPLPVARRHPARDAAPASVEECYKMAMEAFDLAERLQTLVFVMSDLDLGMNTWMSEPFRVSRQADRSRQGARRGEGARDRRAGAATRTSTATASRIARCPATACRRTSRAGSGHNERRLQRAARRLRRNLDRLRASSRRRGSTCRAEVVDDAGADIGIIAYGTSHWAIEEAAISCARPASRPAICGCGRTRSRRRSTSSSTLRSRLRRRAEPRRADAEPAALELRRSIAASCAACCTTTACRSTRVGDRRHPSRKASPPSGRERGALVSADEARQDRS